MSTYKKNFAARLAEEFSLDVEQSEAKSALDTIFSERPPTLTEFVQSDQYLNNPPLSSAQFEFVRHFEQIYYPETYNLMSAEWGDDWIPCRYVNELVTMWGKGSIGSR